MATLFIWALITVLPGSFLYWFIWRQSALKRFPSGPTGWPIIGNLMDLPPHGVPEYQHWLKCKDKYGPFFGLDILGQKMLIVHDKDAVYDLLESRSKSTSSRPTMEFAHKLCGGQYVTLQNYNDKFRQQRRFVHQEMGTKKLVEQYRDIQRSEVARMLLQVLQTPQEMLQHFKK
jgi:hypothetical protein